MFIELVDLPADIQMNKWHTVHTIQGVVQEHLYIDFKTAWDLEGNKLHYLLKGMTAIVEVDFITIEPLKNYKDYYYWGMKLYYTKKAQE